ncbi:SMI1/KNR4 family protein [Paenibacillus sp. Z6-24]
MSKVTFYEQLKGWQEQWRHLVEALQAKGAEATMMIGPPAAPEQIAKAESRLGIPLPRELKELLVHGGAEGYVVWSIMDDVQVPFGAAGDLGWSLQALEFPDFWDETMTEQKRFLGFHHAGNGDMLLLDLESHTDHPAVVHWYHEANEFKLLAGSLTDFLDRVTALYGIGAESWQYEPFLDHLGINVNSVNARRWANWINDFLHLTLEEAKDDLRLLIRYAEVRGTAQQELRDAFAAHDPQAVFQAWMQRIDQEKDKNIRNSLMEYAGAMNGQYAADWVRSLWALPEQERINSAVLANLTASCLPEEEGLNRVWTELERAEQEKRLNGYMANCWLKPFRSRRVIEWMSERKRVSYPYDGWDQLFAISNPSAEDVIRWLNGNGVQRQVVITVLARFANPADIFTDREQVQQTRMLLNEELERAVIKKEKNMIGGALLALNDLQWNESNTR